MSLKSKLQNIIKERGEVEYGEMCKIVAELGYKMSHAERRLRPSDSPYVIPIEKRSARGTWYVAAYKWDYESEKKFGQPHEPIKSSPLPSGGGTANASSVVVYRPPYSLIAPITGQDIPPQPAMTLKTATLFAEDAIIKLKTPNRVNIGSSKSNSWVRKDTEN